MFLRKAAPVSCFYCLAVQNPSPRDARAFQCTECATWNRYSRLGEILSDEPAMHTAALNVSNFARRGVLVLGSFGIGVIIVRSLAEQEQLAVLLPLQRVL